MEEKVKKELINVALQSASEILIHAMQFTESKNYINGTIVEENSNEIYELKFRRISLNEKTVSEANRENLCDKCGKTLTLVRPGKYQCDKCVD